jgi:CheY-like chemotaxis protein
MEPGRPLSIVIADDNIINQEVMSLYIGELGYTAKVVSNGAEALHAVMDEQVDLVLMDIRMPGMDGIEATQAIREWEARFMPKERRPVRIVALTADAVKSDSEKCLAIGMDDYLCKPVDPDQIEAVIAKLCRQPFTRQAQMITWMPSLDLDCFDPPCLQSLWYRVLEDADGVWWLNTNVRFRSNDAWGASFMNLFGLTMFSKELVADELARRTGREVRLGRLNWQADSYHIYGKDIEQAEQRLFNRLETTAFEDRVYNFRDPDIQEMYREAEAAILAKVAETERRMAREGT